MSADNPYLDLALEGVHLVEASAGTGKTWTLATLVTRLVVERGLRIGQILTVTYTEAATQELRKRIRERLQLALDLVDAPPVEGEGAEAAVTRQLLHAHLQRGEEMGRFLLGSTVVLLMPQGGLQFNPAWKEATPVRLGEAMAQEG